MELGACDWHKCAISTSHPLTPSFWFWFCTVNKQIFLMTYRISLEYKSWCRQFAPRVQGTSIYRPVILSGSEGQLTVPPSWAESFLTIGLCLLTPKAYRLLGIYTYPRVCPQCYFGNISLSKDVSTFWLLGTYSFFRGTLGGCWESIKGDVMCEKC